MSAPSPSSELRTRNLRMLAGLAALFLLPLAAVVLDVLRDRLAARRTRQSW